MGTAENPGETGAGERTLDEIRQSAERFTERFPDEIREWAEESAKRLPELHRRLALAESLAETLRIRVKAEEALLELVGPLGVVLPDDRYLKGREIGEMGAVILEEERIETIHYRDLFDMFEERGYAVHGKEPQAILLTNIARHPRFESLGENTGQYRLLPGEGNTPRS